MKRSIRPIGTQIALFALLISLAGCVGGKSAPARFYLLTPLASLPSQQTIDRASNPVTIGIGPVDVAAYLDRAQIVTRRGQTMLDLAEFDRWAEPLQSSIPRVMLENLSVLLASQRLTLVPEDKHPRLDCQLVVRITRFDGVLDRHADLGVRWILFDRDHRKIIEWENTVIQEPVTAAGYQALVEAQSRALTEFCRNIAESIDSWRKDQRGP